MRIQKTDVLRLSGYEVSKVQEMQGKKERKTMNLKIFLIFQVTFSCMLSFMGFFDYNGNLA